MQTSDSPRPADLLPAEVADLADRFVAHVGAYIEWDKMHKLTAATAHPTEPGSPAEADFLSRLESTSARKYDEAAKIRSVGPRLAGALERYDFDSSGVLSIVHCTGASGGGPDYVRPNWEQHKVALQRAAIQLRNAQAGETDLIDRLVTTPTPPRLSDDELAQMRVYLKTPLKLPALQADPAERERRQRLKEIVAYNDELRAKEVRGDSLTTDTELVTEGYTNLRDDLLHYLADRPDRMAALIELPKRLQDPDMLAVSDADCLIEFGERKHCWVGPVGKSELCVEKGWDFGSITGPNRKPMDEILAEARTSTDDERIRLHIRLTSKGRIHVARLKAGPPASEIAQKPPTAETNWRDVQRLLLEMCDNGEAYTNLRDLMERTGCRSTSTVSKAIKRSTTLNAWQARYTKGKASPRASSLTGMHLDNIAQTREVDPAEAALRDDPEEVLAHLIQDAEPKVRAKLNAITPKDVQDMTGDQVRQMAEMIANNPDDYDGVLGRKP